MNGQWRLAPISVKESEMHGAGTSEVHKPGGWKPHMERRPGETVTEWRARLTWSCYLCGRQFEPGQRQALNDHEDTHTSH